MPFPVERPSWSKVFSSIRWLVHSEACWERLAGWFILGNFPFILPPAVTRSVSWVDEEEGKRWSDGIPPVGGVCPRSLIEKWARAIFVFISMIVLWTRSFTCLQSINTNWCAFCHWKVLENIDFTSLRESSLFLELGRPVLAAHVSSKILQNIPSYGSIAIKGNGAWKWALYRK